MNCFREVLSCGLPALLIVVLAGCGTTRVSDTHRTATEQLLLSSAIDRAINQMNFDLLAGKHVYLDSQYLRGVTDEHYVVSSLRQQLLSHGCLLVEDKEEATYVVEARAGAVGTDRHEVLVGVPAVNLPTTAVPGLPSAIPEIPFAKSSEQKGVAKLAVFAYNRTTGQAVWQSGAFPITATARDTWLAGSGPFQRGSIYDGTQFNGSKLLVPLTQGRSQPLPVPTIPVTAEAVFSETSEPSSHAEALSSDTGESSPARVNEQIVAASASQDVPAPKDKAKLQVSRPGSTDRVGLKSTPPSPREPARLFEDDSAGQQHLGQVEVSPSANPHKPRQDGFNLLNPKTWFGRSRSEKRG